MARGSKKNTETVARDLSSSLERSAVTPSKNPASSPKKTGKGLSKLAKDSNLSETVHCKSFDKIAFVICCCYYIEMNLNESGAARDPNNLLEISRSTQKRILSLSKAVVLTPSTKGQALSPLVRTYNLWDTPCYTSTADIAGAVHDLHDMIECTQCPIIYIISLFQRCSKDSFKDEKRSTT